MCLLHQCRQPLQSPSTIKFPKHNPHCFSAAPFAGAACEIPATPPLAPPPHNCIQTFSGCNDNPCRRQHGIRRRRTRLIKLLSHTARAPCVISISIRSIIRVRELHTLNYPTSSAEPIPPGAVAASKHLLLHGTTVRLWQLHPRTV